MPYRPSWVDRFTDWVDSLPVPAWAFYAGTSIALVLVQLLFLWLDGGLAVVGVLLPIMVFNALFPYVLALIHLLDDQAVAALSSMGPALEISGEEFDDFRYKLSNMPAYAPLITGLLVLLSLILTEVLWIAPDRFGVVERLPVFGIVFHIVDKAPAFVFGAFMYHTVRQLRMVNSIHSSYTRISLFDLGPSQAFSRLTATTAVGLVIGVIGWMLINPELLADPVSLVFAAFYTILPTAVFVWPLWGAHKMLAMEKAKELREVDRRLEEVLKEFNRLVDDCDYASTEALNGTISSLDIQRRRIDDIPTWPWRSETARIALTAIALPLLLMVLQFFVFQVLE
jgi:hypothetical protein